MPSRRASVAWLVIVCASSLLLALTPAGAVDTTTPGAPLGNVTPTTQPKSGVAAVAISAPVDGQVAVLVHNGTTKPVRIDRVTAVATRVDGGLVTSGRTATTYPQVLVPDQLALAAVTFRKGTTRADSTVTAKVRSTPVSAAAAARALTVGELALSAPMTGPVAQTMRATLTNATSSWTARTPAAAVMCFGEGGTPTTIATAKATPRRVVPGEAASVSVPLTSLCPTYLVAARAT